MNREQILALAPDTASISAAKSLGNPKVWGVLGYSGRAVWGECKGSGANPYQARIDLSGNAFKCSCPSRKFPCKHGLALFLLYAEELQHFTQTDAEPPWVAEWLASRGQRAEAKKAPAAAKPVDPKAQAKRQQQRDGEMAQGLAELGLWLEDIVRIGFAELPAKPLRYWDEWAARMVDAKMPGLAGRIRKLSAVLLQKSDNLHLFAQEIARLHLLVKAYPQRHQLPAGLCADINQVLGLAMREDEVLQAPAVNDEWLVLATRFSEENALVTREVWLLGTTSGQFAKLLHFAHASQRQTLQTLWLTGNRLRGNAHFYPSATPLRAVLGDYQNSPQQAGIGPAPQHSAFWQDYSQLKIRNPWLGAYPVLTPPAIPIYQEPFLYLQLPDGPAIPVDTRGTAPWPLLAMSGGQAVSVFGEWDGERLQVLGVWYGQTYANLTARAVA